METTDDMMKKIMCQKISKRGQAEYLFENAFRIGFMIVAVIAFFLLINYYLNNKIDTNQLQEEVALVPPNGPDGERRSREIPWGLPGCRPPGAPPIPGGPDIPGASHH